MKMANGDDDDDNEYLMVKMLSMDAFSYVMSI